MYLLARPLLIKYRSFLMKYLMNIRILYTKISGVKIFKVNIANPKIIKYFPSLEPVGTYIIDPIQIKTEANCTDTIMSIRSLIMDKKLISIIFLYPHLGNVGKLNPIGNNTANIQITLFFIPFLFFGEGLIIYNPQFTISIIKDNAARENNRYNRIKEPITSILLISTSYVS